MPNAEALGYLEAMAKARTTADSSAALRNDKQKDKGKCYCGYFTAKGALCGEVLAGADEGYCGEVFGGFGFDEA